jgi:hypothetical protein
MSAPSSPSFTFGHGWVESRAAVRFICEIDTGGGPQPALARWADQGKPWPYLGMRWMPVRLALVPGPPPCNFMLGGDGRVGFGYGSYSEELINDTATGPKGRGPLRELRWIGAHLYAAGMGRQVYRRLGPAQWEALDPPRVPQPGEITVCGFTSLDGVDENDVWAVGYKGEMWNRKGGQWHEAPALTNVTLHKVRMVRGDLGFVSGKKGIVMRYDGSSWAALPHLAGADDIWDLEWFGDRLYAASAKKLYVLQPDDTFAEVKVENVTSFGHLHAADGVLWSFGTLQLAWTVDGQHWNWEQPPRP